MKPIIETIHRTRIEWDVPFDDSGESSEKIDKFVDQLGRDFPDLDFDNAHGGPCWNYYLIIEGADKHDVEKAARKFIAYVQRFRDHKFYE